MGAHQSDSTAAAFRAAGYNQSKLGATLGLCHLKRANYQINKTKNWLHVLNTKIMDEVRTIRLILGALCMYQVLSSLAYAKKRKIRL